MKWTLIKKFIDTNNSNATSGFCKRHFFTFMNVHILLWSLERWTLPPWEKLDALQIYVKQHILCEVQFFFWWGSGGGVGGSYCTIQQGCHIPFWERVQGPSELGILSTFWEIKKNCTLFQWGTKQSFSFEFTTILKIQCSLSLKSFNFPIALENSLLRSKCKCKCEFFNI